MFFKMLHFYLVFLFYEIFVENYFINLKFPEDFRCVTLDRIKRMLFSGNCYLGLLKILLENLFFYKKKAVTDHLLVSFFQVKNQKEPIAIKMHIHTAKSYSAMGIRKKYDGNFIFIFAVIKVRYSSIMTTKIFKH